MKKFLFVVLLVICIPSFVSFAADGSSKTAIQAPEYRNAIDIGYNPGPLSIMKLAVHSKVDNLIEQFPIYGLIIGSEVSGFRSNGTVSLSYLRSLNNWLWLGVNVDYENVKIDLQDYSTDEISSVNVNCIPAMVMARADWLRRANVTLYSKLGVGVVTAVIEKGGIKNYKVAPQLTPIGVEFGANHVYGFMEGGIGLQGTLVYGVRFLF